MTKITRLECEEIIDKLADKTLCFGCLVRLPASPSILDDNGVELMPALPESTHRFCGLIFKEKGIYILDNCFEIVCKFGGKYKVLGHPVMLGDVLRFLFKDEMSDCTFKWFKALKRKRDTMYLLWLWWKCDFSKSLQQILEEAEEEDGFITNPAKDLFIFIKKLV